MNKNKISVYAIKSQLLFLVCIIFFMGIMPTIAAYADESNLIKMQNGLINIRQMGNGGPSVVFETGYGDALISEENTDVWNGIQDYAAMYAKTIAYDRFGLGKSSDIGNMPSLNEEQREEILNGGFIKYNKNNFCGQYKTARDKAINLHNILEKAAVKKPYVIVAHSIGSFTAIEFSKLYKNEVEGVVMLDGTPPDLTSQIYKWSKANSADLAKEFFSQFTNQDGSMDEVLISILQCEKDIKALKNIPVLYLQSSDKGLGKEINQLSERSDINMLSNWNLSKRVIVPNSTHYVHRDNPDFVNNAIKDFIYEINSK